MNDNLSAGDSSFVGICAFCYRHLLSDDLASDRESTSICGDCKFLFLEDFETPIEEGYMMPRQSRRRRFNSNGSSFENPFLQHSTPIMTSPVNQIQSFGSEYGNDSIDGNASTPAFQSSSRTTPNGSRRWRSLSHAGSEMYDSDSSLSFGICSVLHGVQLWDSDVSVDDDSFLDNELGLQPDELTDTESDTDIDPMNAGFYSWDSDDPEEVDSNVEGVRRGHVPSLYAELSELVNHNSNQSESIGIVAFDELIESLAGAVDARIGAPPAAVSIVDTLPQIVIKEDHEKLNNELNCAICKDSLPVDTIVNQLPCSHMYHSDCILPWLSTRNSCPLCRYELPTDDPDYEEKKQSERNALNTNIITEQVDVDEENDSSAFSDAEADFEMDQHEPDSVHIVPSEGNTRRCLFLAAAPVVGIVSIVLMFCFGNSVGGNRRWSYNRTGFSPPG